MALVINSTTYRSPNFESRLRRIEALVIHTGEGTLQSDLDALCDNRRPLAQRVSAHYYVCRNGVVYQLVDDVDVAWHAGVSRYLERSYWNAFALGAESEHRQGQDWPRVQKQAFTDLALAKIQQYGIGQQLVVTHRWIAPTRKIDPTDWSDDEFKAWRASLYVPVVTQPDYAAAWGTAWEYFAQSGIAVEWRRHYKQLGAAITDEHTDPGTQMTVRWFTTGCITYDPHTGTLRTYVGV